MSSVSFDMDATQLRALKLYLESATIENDYKPISFAKLEDMLKSEGYKASSSALQRWSKKFQFAEQLEAQIQLTMVSEKENSIKNKAVANAVEKRLVDIKRNNELTADCYEMMELFVQQVATNYDNTNIIKRDDIKIIKDIAVFTGGREDKLLDRIANSDGEKLTSEELKEQFEMIDVEIEDE